jgi:hypothetical protein
MRHALWMHDLSHRFVEYCCYRVLLLMCTCVYLSLFCTILRKSVFGFVYSLRGYIFHHAEKDSLLLEINPCDSINTSYFIYPVFTPACKVRRMKRHAMRATEKKAEACTARSK